MTVSLVIPGRNTASTIRPCLAAVTPLLEAGRLAEIIFVDDGSTDDTVEVVRTFPVRYIAGEGRGPGAARNLGWRAASGDLIWFMDSDCIAEPDALDGLLRQLEDPRVGAVGGGLGNANPESLLSCLVHEEIVERHLRMPDRVDFLAAANVIYRRALLEQVGGFNERYIKAQDAELAFRVQATGHELAFDVNSRVRHHYITDWWQYLFTQAQQGYWRVMLHWSHRSHPTSDSYSGVLDHAQPPLAVLLVATCLLTLLSWSLWPGVMVWPACGSVLLLVLLLLAQVPLTARMMWRTWQLRYAMFSVLSFLRAFWRGAGMVLGSLELLGRRDREQVHEQTVRSNVPVDDFLRTDHLSADLKGRSVRGGAISLFAQACILLINLGATAVLARMLSIDDFGLIAMVLTLTAFVENFRDLGLSMATVQRAEITHAQVSTLFWLNVGLGLFVGLLTALLAPAVAWFYGSPELIGITVAFSGAFVLGGLTVQHQALLRRQMRFATLAVVQVNALLAGAVAGIVAAHLGAGYWALVIMPLTNALVTLIATWIACDWRPSPPVRRSGVRSMVSFGGNLAASNVLNYVFRNLDNVLVGKLCGTWPLGLYSKAYQLLLLPLAQINTPITYIALPTLSRLQDDPARYRNYYRWGVQLVTAIAMPVAALMFVAADRIILLLLGPNWSEAVPILRLLGPAAFAGTLNVAPGWVNVSLGRTDRALRWNAFAAIVATVAFLIGVRWGPQGVAAACSLLLCGLIVPGTLYAIRGTPIGFGDVIGAVWRPATSSVAAAVLLVLVRTLWTDAGMSLLGLLLDVLGYALAYAAIWCILPQGRRTIRDLFGLLKTIRAEKGATAANTLYG